jgi:hypothetical protein
MKAVNKFQGYEHVKSSIEFTARGTGMSFTALRNVLKTGNEQQAFDMWNDAFNGGQDGAKPLPAEWIKHLMDVSRAGMGVQQKPAVQQPAAPAIGEMRLFNALMKPSLNKLSNNKKGMAEGLGDTQKKIEDTILKLEQRLKFAKTPEQWDNIKDRIERLQAGLNRSKQGVAEGAPIVVAQAPIDIRNPKKAPQPFRNQGDIVPDTKPVSTEKRGVKGRPGQRPMPKYDESVDLKTSLQELSNDMLGKYKKAAGADASKADKEGNVKRGDKRFSGIVKATNKQFANDAKKTK